MDGREDAAAQVAGWLARAGQVTALTGAGLSTGSGIADYRGPQGLWTKDPRAEKLSDIRYYVSDPEIRRMAWQRRIESGIFEAEPNAGHLALAELERAGRLHTVVTQNIDGLHAAAGTSLDRLVEVHGTVLDTSCLECGWRGPTGPILDRVTGGDADPACDGCGGILKTATVSFGQSLDPDDLQRAFDAAATCDVFLAIGTSLGVHPVAGLPEVASSRGATLVIANAEPTPFDAQAALVVREDLTTFLPRVVAALELA
jgi:NAD-dependent deacetylase